jgi:hypothetical protein
MPQIKPGEPHSQVASRQRPGFTARRVHASGRGVSSWSAEAIFNRAPNFQRQFQLAFFDGHGALTFLSGF